MPQQRDQGISAASDTEPSLLSCPQARPKYLNCIAISCFFLAAKTIEEDEVTLSFLCGTPSTAVQPYLCLLVVAATCQARNQAFGVISLMMGSLVSFFALAFAEDSSTESVGSG